MEGFKGITSGRNRSRYKANGVITVFLSLISILILSLICMTLESARIQGARAQTANVTEMGNYSVFGEYEKKLLEDYEIFSVDGSYGTGDFSIDRVNSRLQSYLSVNANPKKEGLTGLCFDPWNLQADGSEITKYALLSDQGGEPFYQQAVAYMRKTAVTGSAGKLFQYYRDSQIAENKQKEYSEKKNASDSDMENLERQEAEKRRELEEQEQNMSASGSNEVIIADSTPAETVKKENPLKALNRLRKMSILEIVCGQKPSDKQVSKKELASKRAGEKGNMSIEKQYGGLTDNLLFREYLLDHFPNYLSTGTEEKLVYQIEYIIGGKTSDNANLKAVVQKLLLLREGMNYLYCAENGEMSAQAGSLAALLIGWTGIPALVTVMKHALLLGWAYGESLMDVRTLLDGGKIPLQKTPDTWIVTLDNLGGIDELLNAGGSERQEGIAYRDYLRLLLNLQSVSDQKKRALDMVELNLKNAAGLSNFQVDHCIVGIQENTEWTIKPVFARVPAVFLKTAEPFLHVTVDSGFAYD